MADYLPIDTGAPRPPYAGLIRVRALACLVGRGLRDVACTNEYQVEDLPAVAREFGVVFVERGLDSYPEKFDLNDRLVIFRAPRDPRLSQLWREHRDTLLKGVEVGRALGYFRPQVPGFEGGRWLWHLAHVPDGPGRLGVVLWTEYVDAPPLSSSRKAELEAYTARIRDALAKIGVAHSTRFETWGSNP